MKASLFALLFALLAVSSVVVASADYADEYQVDDSEVDSEDDLDLDIDPESDEEDDSEDEQEDRLDALIQESQDLQMRYAKYQRLVGGMKNQASPMSCGSDSCTCPLRAAPVSNGTPNTFNGCGNEGAKLLHTVLAWIAPSFTDSCNHHDLCYGRCGSSKAVCDTQFKNDLYAVCDAHQQAVAELDIDLDAEQEGVVCKAKAYTFYQAVNKAGKAAFIAAQRQNCMCK